MQERKNHLSALAGSAILFLLLTAAFNLANAAPPAQKVNVVNTPNVTVANPSTNAVAVRGADNPGFQPFHALRVGYLNTGQPGQIIDLMAVPAGKRAVIETFTVNTQLPSGQKPQIMIITTTSGTRALRPVGEIPGSMNGISASCVNSRTNSSTTRSAETVREIGCSTASAGVWPMNCVE